MAFSELDKLALYFEKSQSFYMSDDRIYDMVSLYPDMGGKLREKVIHQIDPHAVPSFRDGYFVEVAALHGTRDIPIYLERSIIRSGVRRFALFVEALPVPLWVLGPPPDESASATTHGGIGGHFVEAVAYWMWQFAPSISDAVNLIDASWTLKIEVSFTGDFSARPSNREATDPVELEVSADPGSATVFVQIDSAIMQFLDRSDNLGERVLIRSCLRGLRLLLPPSASTSLSDDVIARCLDRHAPLGPKKKILTLDPRRTPSLDSRGLPPLRLVPEAIENEASTS